MKEILYLIVVPITVIFGNMVVEYVKARLSQRAEQRKEKAKTTEGTVGATAEVRKAELQTESAFLQQVITRGQSLEVYVDELRKRLEEALRSENERLRQENIELRANLSNALLAVQLLKRHVDLPNEVASLTERIERRATDVERKQEE